MFSRVRRIELGTKLGTENFNTQEHRHFENTSLLFGDYPEDYVLLETIRQIAQISDRNLDTRAVRL